MILRFRLWDLEFRFGLWALGLLAVGNLGSASGCFCELSRGFGLKKWRHTDGAQGLWGGLTEIPT